jgi:hypothetical protein
MPSRTVPYVQGFDYGVGVDTASGWEPPNAIAPGATGGMQSESGGVLTGTEGYVKYQVAGPDGAHGVVYIYWDNPYYGVTHPGWAATGGNVVTPDCDVDQPGDASRFPVNNDDLDFRLVPMAYRHLDGGGDIISPNDIAAAFVLGIGGIVGGVLDLLGFEGIVDDPIWEYELRDATRASWMTPGFSTARNPIHLDVFWNGGAAAIGSTWWHDGPGTSWADHQPFPITPPGAARPDSPIAAVARASDHLDVFWIGPDGAIGSTWWHDGAGNSWGDHQPFPITPPGAQPGYSKSEDQLYLHPKGLTGPRPGWVRVQVERGRGQCRASAPHRPDPATLRPNMRLHIS